MPSPWECKHEPLLLGKDGSSRYSRSWLENLEPLLILHLGKGYNVYAYHDLAFSGENVCKFPPFRIGLIYFSLFYSYIERSPWKSEVREMFYQSFTVSANVLTRILNVELWTSVVIWMTLKFLTCTFKDWNTWEDSSTKDFLTLKIVRELRYCE